MDAVDHLVTGLLKVKHSHGKTISSGTLYSGLKNTTTNQSVPSPLPSVSVLAVNSDAELFLSPRSGEQLELRRVGTVSVTVSDYLFLLGEVLPPFLNVSGN